jgi:putative phage-type endonuclease
MSTSTSTSTSTVKLRQAIYEIIDDIASENVILLENIDDIIYLTAKTASCMYPEISRSMLRKITTNILYEKYTLALVKTSYASYTTNPTSCNKKCKNCNKVTNVVKQNKKIPKMNTNIDNYDSDKNDEIDEINLIKKNVKKNLLTNKKLETSCATTKIPITINSCHKAKYENPCLKKFQTDNPDCEINNPKKYLDLQWTKFDCNKLPTDNKYSRRLELITKYRSLPQVEQKSEAWHTLRNSCITATAIAKVLDEDPYGYPISLLLEKCHRGPEFIQNIYCHHGNKYETIGSMFYEFRHNVKVDEYGLIKNDKYSFIGISPDMICSENTYCGGNKSKLVGRLGEIKFPKTRKILFTGDIDGTICPHQYYLQVQAQLNVTELDECDFIQFDIEEYANVAEYENDEDKMIVGQSIKTGLEKGCIIQLSPKEFINSQVENQSLFNSKYIYPPKLHMSLDEITKWIYDVVTNFEKYEPSGKYVFDRVIYWRLKKVACHLIKKDTEWFESVLPTIKQFWTYITFYRQNPEKLDKIEEYANKVGIENSKNIFLKVHDHYTKSYPKSTFKPLYQNENMWRTKFNNKKRAYVRKVPIDFINF